MSRALNAVLAIVSIGISLVALYYAAGTLASLDKALAVALISGAALIVAAWIGRIFERRKEIEGHFRQKKYDQYSQFLEILYGFFSKSTESASSDGSGPPEEVVKQLNAWQWRLILFASPATIQAYVAWMDDLKGGEPRIRTVLLMEAFFRSLRSGLGISNFGLKSGDFSHFMLRHGALFCADGD